MITDKHGNPIKVEPASDNEAFNQDSIKQEGLFIEQGFVTEEWDVDGVKMKFTYHPHAPLFDVNPIVNAPCIGRQKWNPYVADKDGFVYIGDGMYYHEDEMEELTNNMDRHGAS